MYIIKLLNLIVSRYTIFGCAWLNGWGRLICTHRILNMIWTFSCIALSLFIVPNTLYCKLILLISWHSCRKLFIFHLWAKIYTCTSGTLIRYTYVENIDYCRVSVNILNILCYFKHFKNYQHTNSTNYIISV